MKLHLPTALRRALLAITALLSPAVVTTTIATATLASFSAAAMAEDYTLLDVEVLNKDVEYGSVTVDKRDTHIAASNVAGWTPEPTFTAETLTVNSECTLAITSDIEKVDKVTLHTKTLTVNGTIKATYIDHFVLDATTINVGENGAINIGWDVFGGSTVNHITLNVGSLNVGEGARIRINAAHGEYENRITCEIGGTITNNGIIDFYDNQATINIVSSGFQAEYSYSLGNNGYKVASIYTVHTGTGIMEGITNCTWQVDSATASYANGKVTVSGLDTSVFYVKNGEVKYGTVVPPLATPSTKFSLEGGRLELGRELGVHQGIIAKTAGSSVEIVRGTELKSNQVTVEGSGSVVLSGGGSYTMANGTNTLGTGVSVGSGWSGTVNTTGNTTELALDKLGVNGSNVVLGSNNHTLAARDQSVAANLTSTGSISLTGNKLTLSGTNELGSLNVGSLEIAGGSTTITNGLTTGRESSVATGATLNIKGNSTLGGKITNNGTLNLSGTINVDSTALTAETSERYSDRDNGYKTVDTTYTVLTGNAATGTATWKVGTDSATYKNGLVIVAGIENKSVYYVKNGVVNYDTGAENLKTLSTKFSLEGGSLELGKELVDDQGIVAKTASSSVKILSGTELKSNQVTVEGSGSVVLSGGGSYTMANGANTLGDGVSLSDDWRGTVNTIGDTTALELNTLGVSGSNVVLGSNNHTLAARNQSVAANITSTGSISLTDYKLTLSGTNNKLGSVSVGSLEITGGSTAISNGLTTDSISGTVSVTGGTLQEMTAGSAISTSGSVSLSNVTLGAVLNNNGTLELSGTINVDSTALTAGTRERYSAGDNGYKTIDTTYTVLTGAAATGSATWKVGTDSATYKDGLVIVAGIENKSVYYVKNGDVDYTQSLAQATTIFSLEGGHLQLGETLLDTQSIVSKNNNSWVSLKDEAVQLKSSQISLDGAEFVTLQAADGGTYIIDKKVGDIVELTLGTGVKLAEGLWWGTVKTTGATTVSSDLDTTGWKNTELNGTTTVKNGVTLTLGGNTTLKGKIVNNGSLVLGGNIDVLSSMTHTSKATFATTDDASDLGTESGSGFASSLDEYSVVEGKLATGSATWTVNGQAAHYDSGKVSLLTGKETSTWWMNTAAAYSSISGNFVTGSTIALALNTEGGTLQLDTDPGVKLVSKKAATIEIGNNVTLNAAQLDASAADVTLGGSGSYTLEDGANTLGEGVNVGTGWRGTVNTTGDTTALELDKLGVSGSNVVLGSNNHTLADRDQSVAANLNSTGKLYLRNNKLTLSGTNNTLDSLTVGSLEIDGGSTTIRKGLTTGGAITNNGELNLSGTNRLNGAITNNGELNLSGTSTLRGTITNSGTLTLGGNITILKDGFAFTTINPHYQQGSSSTKTTSGFLSNDGMQIQVVTGTAADDTGASWSVDGVTNGSYTFDEATGKLHVVSKDSVRTEFYINTEDTITYDQNDAMFKNINEDRASKLVLNGGDLKLSTELHEETVQIRAQQKGTVEIGEGVHLNASQLDVSQLIASDAAVTLTGKGTYILADKNSTLGANVKLGSDWSGTLQTSGDTNNMDLGQLAQGSSSLELGSNNHTLAAQNQSVAANLNSTGSISLTGYKLTLSGTNNKLGSLNVGSLEIAGGSTTVDNGLTTGGDSSVATGATLNINGTSTLGGKITNNGTLNLSDNSTLGGKITNSGTLNLGGNITIDYSKFEAARDVTIIDPHYQQGSSAESMSSGFMSSDGMTIQVVEGNAANATGANWSVTGVTDGSYTFDATSGELHVVSNGRVGTEFYINDRDIITYDQNDAMFKNINGDRASKLVLNGGDLKLSTELHEETAQIRAQQAGTVEIGNGVTLNASQLDASNAAVELSGKGTYTMVAGANTLGKGVSLGEDWTGRVELTGGASALDISSLGVSGSVICFCGTGVYTLAEVDHTVDATVEGGDSVLKMNGGALALNKTTTLKGVYGANAISAANATFSDGLTTNSISGTVSVTGGTLQEMAAGSAISTSGTVALSDVTLGAVLNNSGTLSFHGDMVLDTNLLGNPTDTENWYSDSNDTDQSVGGWYGSTSGSGFRTIQDIYTVVTGQDADNQATTWKVDAREAEYDSGKVLAFRDKDLTTYWVNTNSEISLDTADDAFTVDTTTIALNGGKLEMDTNTELDLESHAVSTVVISNDVTLNASKLNASAADVTLSGEGSYDLQGQELSGTLQLGAGVSLDKNAWKGTVYTGSVAQGAALDITALGKSQSTVHLGARPMLRATPSETELESLTAAGVGTTVIPGSLTLLKDTSTADTLVVNGTLTLGSTNTAASLEADTVSLQRLNFAHADSSLKADKLNLEGSTTLNVQLPDEVLSNKDAGETLTLLTLANGFDGTLTFNDDTETERVRSGDNRKEYTLAWDETGTVLTLTILGTETYVTEQVAPTTHNGSAGVALMTEAFLNSRPQKEAPEGALAGILNAVDAGAATDRDMAAVAGASTAALGMALSGDVERQLSAIRNRSVAGNDAGTVTLASGKSGMLAAAPARFFAWVNAEGNRAEQDADSTAAGYTLSSWGGTLGAGMQVNDKLTLGLALTAMYGDLQSDGPDSLKGDMDTTYVSAFARYNKGKWSHAFIGTVGSMEADYKRTVSHAAGSYSTAGDTDGTALGLMYEVSRGVQLSNRSTLSPVFNISYRHTEVDSYSESGADAALNVGKQSLDTVTAGAGARYAAVVGQRMLNRACGFEARALVKYDLGDRQSTTSTGFINRANRAGIESAELGAFGVELGAGISVPVRTGSIFADAAVELRSDYTNMNGTVGYRVQF